MSQIVELANAVAWPVAGVIIAIVVLLVVWRVTGSSGDLSLGVKDWIKLSRTSQGQKAATNADMDSPTLPSPEKQSSAQTLAEVAEEETSKATDHIFWIDENSGKLEASFKSFKETTSYTDDPEFWDSLYIERRSELAIGHEEHEFKALATANGNWVWPLIFLIRRYIRLHDAARGEQTLAEALARKSEKRHWVLREGVSLYFQLFGSDRALQFCREQLTAGASDKEISEMFKAMADRIGSEDDPFSKAILQEIAANYGGADKDLLFNLAYSYGSVPNFGVIAYQRYSKLGIYDKDWSSSPNNIGVAIESVSVSLQRDYYEQAMTIGSGIAFANLARQLVSDGYVKRAEILLETAPPDTSEAGASALAEARAKVITARQKLEKERETFSNFARDQDNKYRALVFAAFDFFKLNDTDAYGAFVSADRTLAAVTDQEGATCVYKLGDKNLSGRLQRKPLCFEGSVSGKNGGGILDYQFKKILLVQVETDLMRAIVWPEKTKQNDPLRVVDLQRVIPAGTTQDAIAIPAPAELLEDRRADDGTP